MQKGAHSSMQSGQASNLTKKSIGTDLGQAIKSLEDAFKCLVAYKLYAGKPHGEFYLEKADKHLENYGELRKRMGKEMKQ